MRSNRSFLVLQWANSMADFSGWVSVDGFGTAERLTWGGAGEFYSHVYTDQGAKDVVAAAESYIRDTTGGDVQKLALFLLAEEDATTDYYHYGGSERWYVGAEKHVRFAKQILEVLK